MHGARMGGRMRAELLRGGNATPKKPSRCALEPTWGPMTAARSPAAASRWQVPATPREDNVSGKPCASRTLPLPKGLAHKL